MDAPGSPPMSTLKRAYLAIQERDAELAKLRAELARVQHTSEPIAIVGMSCRFPGAESLDAFWRLLIDGVDVFVRAYR